MKQDLLIFRVIEYGMEHQYFSFSKLKADLDLKDLDEKYVWQSLTCWEHFSTQNPNHILVAVQKKPTGTNREVSGKDYILGLLPSAVVSYVDYLEIVEARRNAKQAFWISIGAIIISILIGGAQIYYQATAVG